MLKVMERLRQFTTIFYSTHILDDVQQVSDAVAILNHGQLIAQAPLEELLAGGDGAVYSLVIAGETRQILSKVESQSWVSGVTTSVNDEGHAQWQVSVTDEDAAESELLRLVLVDEQLKVMDWGRKKFQLEEIFLNLVEGDDDGR